MYNPKIMLPQALVDMANSLSLDPNMLNKQLQGGLSLVQIAKTQGIDLQHIKDLLLASYKAQLDEGIKSGQLTQQQADQVYQESGTFIDSYVDSVDELVKNGKFTQPEADQAFKDLPNLISKFIGGEPDQK